MQAPVFGGFMRVVSKRGHVTHGPASILQAPVFGGFMRVVIGRGYETHGPTPPRRADPVWVRQGGSCSLWCMRGRCRGLGFSPRWWPCTTGFRHQGWVGDWLIARRRPPGWELLGCVMPQGRASVCEVATARMGAAGVQDATEKGGWLQGGDRRDGSCRGARCHRGGRLLRRA